MKPILLLFIVLLGFSPCGVAQQVNTNDDTFDPDSVSTEEVDAIGTLFGDSSKGVGTSSGSLRRFCPVPANQSGLPPAARLSLAFSYGAMTILKAKQGQWSGEKIQREAFSKTFLFEMLPKDSRTCKVGPDYLNGIRQVLMQTGNLKATQYDTRPPSCQVRPDGRLQEQAMPYRIDAIMDVFKRHSAYEICEQAIRQTLRNGRPVVAILTVDEGFMRLRSDTWLPNAVQMNRQRSWQPVVIVGYDDDRQAFELFNSLGSNWGDGGFAWLRYADLRYIDRAVSLIDRPDTHPSVRPAAPPVAVQPKLRPSAPDTYRPAIPRPRPMVSLYGEGALQQAVSSDGDTYRFMPMPVVRKETYYELRNTVQLNRDQFQFLSTRLPRFGYVYILSIDPLRDAQLHFPHPGESAYVADEATRLAFPRPIPQRDAQGNLWFQPQGFKKEHPGTDWLVVLYSKVPLTDTQLSRWLAALQVDSDAVASTLEQILGNQMVPWKHVDFAPASLHFTVKTETGNIVPLLIKING